MAAKKPRVIEGWACSSVVSRNDIVISPQWKVEFCSKSRHAKCTREKECDMFRPHCETARNSMGKTPTLDRQHDYGNMSEHARQEMFVLMDKRNRVVHKTLEKLWRKCHPVRVTVERPTK